MMFTKILLVICFVYIVALCCRVVQSDKQIKTLQKQIQHLAKANCFLFKLVSDLKKDINKGP